MSGNAVEAARTAVVEHRDAHAARARHRLSVDVAVEVLKRDVRLLRLAPLAVWFAGCRDLRLDFDRRVDCLREATDAWGRLTRRLLAGG